MDQLAPPDQKTPPKRGAVGWRRLATAAQPANRADGCCDCKGACERPVGGEVQRGDVGKGCDAAGNPQGKRGFVLLGVKLLLHVDLLVPVPPARAGRVALMKRAFEAMSLRARGMTGLQPGPLGPPARGLAWSLSRLVASKVVGNLHRPRLPARGDLQQIASGRKKPGAKAGKLLTKERLRCGGGQAVWASRRRGGRATGTDRARLVHHARLSTGLRSSAPCGRSRCRHSRRGRGPQGHHRRWHGCGGRLDIQIDGRRVRRLPCSPGVEHRLD